MPFGYYVKNGGTATGDGGRVDLSSQRTGTWNAATADYYDNVEEVFFGGVPTTDITSGDFVLCSHLHNKSYNPNSITDSKADGVAIISVDNANQENYLKGATEVGTSSLNMGAGVGTTFYMFGLTLKSALVLSISDANAEIRLFAYDCNFELTGASSTLRVAVGLDGQYLLAENCVFTFGNVTQDVEVAGGAIVDVRGGSVSTAQTDFSSLVGNAGGNFIVSNFDASTMATSGKIINITASADDNCIAEITRCKLPTSGIICNSTAVLSGLNIIGESLKVGTGGGWPQINEIMGAGDNSLETGIYRFSGSKYNLSGKYSVDMTTNSSASFHRFLRHRIAQFYVDTNDFTSTINFLVHFARDGSATEYNDDEFWIDADFNDGADDGLGSSVTTKPAVLATGTAPTTELLQWVGLGTNAQMSVNASATIGASAGNIQSGMVTVWANFAVASDTVFVDKRVVLS